MHEPDRKQPTQIRRAVSTTDSYLAALSEALLQAVTHDEHRHFPTERW
jgi:hypothetical protein